MGRSGEQYSVYEVIQSLTEVSIKGRDKNN